jgi:hypothetical protein
MRTTPPVLVMPWRLQAQLSRAAFDIGAAGRDIAALSERVENPPQPARVVAVISELAPSAHFRSLAAGEIRSMISCNEFCQPAAAARLPKVRAPIWRRAFLAGLFQRPQRIANLLDLAEKSLDGGAFVGKRAASAS